MPFNLLLLLGAAFLVGSALALLRRSRRTILLERLRAGGRRVSGARTPPRSLSPSQKTEIPLEVDYSDSFPPSRRSTLVGILKDEELDEPTEDWTKNMLPIETSYSKADDTKRLPCGFSVKEIKALGNFPDYATLSGVPLPNPCPEFDINKALPRPYRPFRWPYHQTMSLSKLQPDWWIELENTYIERIQQRKTLFTQHGTDVLDALPGSELACKELMETAVQFLCARYPHYFSLSADKSMLQNRILNSETNLCATHPLHVLLDNVPEDFAVMLRDERSGRYVLRAGVICSALGWNLGTKLGKHLADIHAPIPDYKEKMAFSMDRYFSKKPTDKPIQRGSWGLEIKTPLYAPPSSPLLTHRTHQLPASLLPLSDIHLRVDWQTLRRLPLSGAVIFNFKALFTPVQEFKDEPRVPGLLLKVLEEGKKELMEYKGTWHVEHVVKDVLRAWHEEQVAKGWVEEGWEAETLGESPWFEGWEGKWRGMQGF
ncbi:hypothetical protein COCCADRAFT_86138 [Bipolaris zeicola 26-R-13]|uniref:Alpha-1,2-mannosyltransferase n=1 Tax=Cochliobolus carbonum (strain 26-R-13) TaxID=930089 RepID=W6YP10_COCC2|nr:uncharacterized protein COCCADRAFT_86138 [Bipolaris zeicola 26-R-13]EUC37229.1 hypothetical protein COCCADRAFT_86138 [Bipolaris zeicola 26-R-13]